MDDARMTLTLLSKSCDSRAEYVDMVWALRYPSPPRHPTSGGWPIRRRECAKS